MISFREEGPSEPRQRQLFYIVRQLSRPRLLAWLVGACAAVGVLATIGIALARGPGPPFIAFFPKTKQLITNERAYFDPGAPGVRKSHDWLVTSGSLFSDDGAGWTGVPDGRGPNVASSNGTDSAVFRAVTRRNNFYNVVVAFQLRIVKLVTTARTPAQSYDGVHVFLRYQNDRYLYAVSVFRRDGIVAIKEKTPGGPANGGTYMTLAQARYRLMFNRWASVHVTITTVANQGVQIQLIINGHQVLSALDIHHRVAAILRAGRVGLRGDNCEFYFRNFAATPVRT